MDCNFSLDNYLCSDKGLYLPLINEFTWSRNARAVTYGLALIYCFLGVAIISDIFMCSIEKITNRTKKIILTGKDKNKPEVLEVKVWNDTVANLTLMALGSSAPEILLSIIEIIGNKFEAGDLGPGTIVGSAAFNLFVISAVCVIAIPSGECRRIRVINVFAVTAFFSIFAYLWLLVVLVVVTPDIVEVWEAVLTLLFFPILVILSYWADKNFSQNEKTKIKSERQLELVSSKDFFSRNYFPSGRLNKENLINFIKQIRKYPGLTDEDAACLAASRLIEEKDHSRMWYRVGAIRKISGGRKPTLTLSEKLKEVHDAMLTDEDDAQHKSVENKKRENIAIVEFAATSCAVLENVGCVFASIIRHGKTDNKVSCKFETIEGTARATEDYIAKKEIVTFQSRETEKKVFVEIVNDEQWEPDEIFFLKLSLCEGEEEEVILGKSCIMEITILNDDKPGIIEFKRRGLLVKENIGVASIPLVRKHGADGIISCKWRTIDKSAINGKDYIGGRGKLIFENAEVEKNIEIAIINDFDTEKDVQFDIELIKPKGGTEIGIIDRTTVTIINDEDFNSIVGKLMMMTNMNVDALRLQSENWIEQIKDAMNVNGGDLENATMIDYILHFITFGWKVIFSLLIPPTSILGGWLTFFISLIAIGMLTAVIGDMASIFGCLVGLRDTVTAITFVALGTSLPDLFASKSAAVQERYADNAIGNVTGSNSVNVFLGVGLPWVIASLYWKSKGKEFEVKAGALIFTVGIYSLDAFLCICLMMTRRFSDRCGGGELGGSKVLAILSAMFMVFLWISYITLSSLEVYGLLL